MVQLLGRAMEREGDERNFLSVKESKAEVLDLNDDDYEDDDDWEFFSCDEDSQGDTSIEMLQAKLMHESELLDQVIQRVQAYISDDLYE